MRAEIAGKNAYLLQGTNHTVLTPRLKRTEAA
jgi:hypothetical protein